MKVTLHLPHPGRPGRLLLSLPLGPGARLGLDTLPQSDHNPKSEKSFKACANNIPTVSRKGEVGFEVNQENVRFRLRPVVVI